MPAEPDPVARRRIAGTHLLAAGLLSMVSAPLIALFGCNALIGHGSFLPVYVLATLLIAIESTRLMVSDIFAAAGRIYASVATMHYVRSMLALPFVAATVFALGHETLTTVLATYLAVAAIQFAVALYHARTEITLPTLRASISTLRAAIGQGVRVFTVDLSEFMIMQGTIWLATAVLAPVAATQYALAVTLAMQVALFNNLAALALAPPAARLWAAGARTEVVRVLSNAATLSAVVASTLVVLIAAFGGVAVEFAYGRDMRPAATMLLIIAMGTAVQACFNVSATLLIISGHITEAARVALAVLGLAVVSAIAATVFGGPFALAVATCLSLSAMYFSQYVNTRRCLGSAPCVHRHVAGAARELLKESSAYDEPVGKKARSAGTTSTWWR